MRGALALALAVDVTDDLSSPETSRLFFFVGGIVSLSLLINGIVMNHYYYHYYYYYFYHYHHHHHHYHHDHHYYYHHHHHHYHYHKNYHIISLLYNYYHYHRFKYAGSFCRAVLDYLNLKNENSIENTIIVDNLKRRISKKVGKIIEETCKEYQLPESDRFSMKSRCSITMIRNDDGIRNIDNLRHINVIMQHDIDEQLNVDNDNIDNIEIVINEAEDSDTNMNTIKSVSISSASASAVLLQRNRFLSDSTAADERYSRTFNQSMDRFKSSLPYSSSARVQSRVDRITGLSRLLSRADRGSNPTMVPQVLKYVRTIYLEIVRTSYWKGIETGKLQRTSYAVQFLLYSVDLALDEISKGEDNWYIGLKDFDTIQTETSQTPVYLKVIKWLTETTRSSYLHSLLSFIEARRLKRTVVILQSFIEAHVYAAKKIHSFIVDDEDNDEASAEYLPEEIRVKDESLRQVDQAKKLLNTLLDPQTIMLVKSTQATLGVLAKQSDIIKNMINEGLITHAIGELLFEEIAEDKKRLLLELSSLYKKTHPLLETNDDNNSAQESLLS